jgi:hypothetical protein
MSKGWESKAVEEQQAERQQPPVDPRPKIDGPKERLKQELNLQREQVLAARTTSPHRRAALESALTEIEARLQSLG